ncbi:unnamed protein product [Xyrichtys novacula]|uniref:Unnamed protein product n=1 Tax=Xyrichtys novacula TaxID=13765 RepID=A0AAV1FLJ4_XYRNO|nr:unnamed protein product [Xyrichtys novacula]
MSGNRFSRELRAVTSASAVTDEVGKSDGQLQTFLSPRACLALTLCAMFSEGTCQSAVTQADRQMVHVDREHERDWQSSSKSLGGPSELKGESFLITVAWQLGFNCAATHGHQGANGS